MHAILILQIFPRRRWTKQNLNIWKTFFQWSPGGTRIPAVSRWAPWRRTVTANLSAFRSETWTLKVTLQWLSGLLVHPRAICQYNQTAEYLLLIARCALLWCFFVKQTLVLLFDINVHVHRILPGGICNSLHCRHFYHIEHLELLCLRLCLFQSRRECWAV